MSLTPSQSPKEPFHHRHLITQPNTHFLGLENFTVHPETPPLHLLPIRIPNEDSAYALQIPDYTDDLSNLPWIAAILPKKQDPRSAALRKVHGSDPGKIGGGCPEGTTCVGDGWRVDAAKSGDKKEGELVPLGKLGFRGFEGHWEVVKDVPNGGGWHLYWKADDSKEVELGARVEVEVVPVTKLGYGDN
jgi:hypothetical protein